MKITMNEEQLIGMLLKNKQKYTLTPNLDLIPIMVIDLWEHVKQANNKIKNNANVLCVGLFSSVW